MADSRSVIVGGGIQAGTPFNVGSLARIIDDDPPTIADSIAFQRTQGGREVITVGLQTGTDWPLPNTIAERLQVVGGLVSDTGSGADNFLAGRGAIAPTTAAGRNVVIGTLAIVPAAGSGTENVIVGYNSSLQSGIGSSVVVGAGNQQGAAFATATTVVGANNTFNNSFSGPGVGTGSSWQGANVGVGNQQSFSAVNNGIAVGRLAQLNANNGTALGDDTRVDHATSIVMGRGGRSLVANSFIAGAQNLGITTVHFGEGDTIAAPASVTYRHTNASGTDAQGGNVAVVASRGTGNAATQGAIQFQTGTPGASGAALQAAATRLEIRPAGTNGAAVNFIGTSGAGAGAGTLANAPTAGDPADWVPILFNGNVRYLPAWA